MYTVDIKATVGVGRARPCGGLCGRRLAHCVDLWQTCARAPSSPLSCRLHQAGARLSVCLPYHFSRPYLHYVCRKSIYDCSRLDVPASEAAWFTYSLQAVLWYYYHAVYWLALWLTALDWIILRMMKPNFCQALGRQNDWRSCFVTLSYVQHVTELKTVKITKGGSVGLSKPPHPQQRTFAIGQAYIIRRWISQKRYNTYTDISRMHLRVYARTKYDKSNLLIFIVVHSGVTISSSLSKRTCRDNLRHGSIIKVVLSFERLKP